MLKVNFLVFFVRKVYIYTEASEDVYADAFKFVLIGMKCPR
jgi:hypothetical protein